MDIITVLEILGAIAYLLIGNEIGKWYAKNARRICFDNRLDPTIVGHDEAEEWKRRSSETMRLTRIWPIFLWLPFLLYFLIELVMDCPFLRMSF